MGNDITLIKGIDFIIERTIDGTTYKFLTNKAVEEFNKHKAAKTLFDFYDKIDPFNYKVQTK